MVDLPSYIKQQYGAEAKVMSDGILQTRPQGLVGESYQGHPSQVHFPVCDSALPNTVAWSWWHIPRSLYIWLINSSLFSFKLNIFCVCWADEPLQFSFPRPPAGENFLPAGKSKALFVSVAIPMRWLLSEARIKDIEPFGHKHSFSSVSSALRVNEDNLVFVTNYRSSLSTCTFFSI